MRGRTALRAPTWFVVTVVGGVVILCVYVPVAVSLGWSLAWLDAATSRWGTLAIATIIMAVAMLWVFLRYEIWRRNFRAWILLFGFLVAHSWTWATVLRDNPHLPLIYFSAYGPVELGVFGWALFTFCLDTRPRRRRRAVRRRGARRSSPPNPKDPA